MMHLPSGISHRCVAAFGLSGRIERVVKLKRTMHVRSFMPYVHLSTPVVTHAPRAPLAWTALWKAKGASDAVCSAPVAATSQTATDKAGQLSCPPTSQYANAAR